MIGASKAKKIISLYSFVSIELAVKVRGSKYETVFIKSDLQSLEKNKNHSTPISKKSIEFLVLFTQNKKINSFKRTCAHH